MRKQIIFAAGGTGGHLFPAQSLARELKEENDILFVSFDLKNNSFFESNQFDSVEISSAPLSKITSFFSIIKGITQSYRLLSKRKCDLIVGFGSYHCFPILLVGLLKRIPLILFESNAMPGRVNRFFSKWAKVTSISIPFASKHISGKTAIVDVPLRFTKKENLQEAYEYFQLDPDRKTLLIFGGSQGAQTINSIVSDAMSMLKEYQVIHLTGNESTSNKLTQKYKEAKISAVVKPFEKRMDLAYGVADLAICRAGALSIFELLEFELPALLIPYPYAQDDHQSLNAKFFEQDVGGGISLPESLLTADKLVETIRRADFKEMQKKLTSFRSNQVRKSLLQIVKEIGL